ncbi:flagellar motor switch protein FliN [Caldimicrobium thiodismutans]|uniref:Flagellar motor switch protein FliN n=1 Tax=Caldimicrobium thiodismutans TaxID=1653476 RepID=A0A0U4W0Q6_9BACT|nr:flagellar motor switch protein FliN [Caldimicrobium thiodismutans]BAU22747.1 flagellar motor switch protein FliN [Caldimicrobium thiodismutans]
MAEENIERPEEKKEEEALNPEDLMSMWESALKEAQAEKSSQEETSISTPEEVKKEIPVSQPAQLQELKPTREEGLHPEFDFILDIPLEISVEIGRTKMLIKELLKLNQGSIVELEKFAGEPVEVYVNGKLMAKGEVVVVNDRFGVRITEIISAQDRIKRLGS